MTDVDTILAALALLGEDMREKFAELAEDLTGKINRPENLSFVSREIIRPRSRRPKPGIGARRNPRPPRRPAHRAGLPRHQEDRAPAHMTIKALAFIIMPIVLAAGGTLATWLIERADRQTGGVARAP
jgi:hypothetical protein